MDRHYREQRLSGIARLPEFPTLLDKNIPFIIPDIGGIEDDDDDDDDGASPPKRRRFVSHETHTSHHEEEVSHVGSVHSVHEEDVFSVGVGDEIQDDGDIDMIDASVPGASTSTARSSPSPTVTSEPSNMLLRGKSTRKLMARVQMTFGKKEALYLIKPHPEAQLKVLLQAMMDDIKSGTPENEDQVGKCLE